MDQSFSYASGVLINNPSALEEVLGNETLLVVGAARGMTSVVSYTLYEMGYFLGNTLQANNYEDVEFMKQLQIPTTDKNTIPKNKDLKALIKNRNSEHERWGFKLPNAVRFLPELVPMLRNPVVVICVRNPVAVTKSIMQRNPNIRGGLQRAFNTTRQLMPAMSWLLDNENTPSVILDMDQVFRAPEAYLSEFSARLNLGEPSDALAQALSTGGYKGSAAREGVSLLSAQETRDFVRKSS